MSWNIAAECISLVILCIIWIYASKSNPLPTIKNKMFRGCFLTTFCAMVFNILSTVLITNYLSAPLPLTWGVTLLYYIATPLMGMAYYFYTAAILYEKHEGIWKLLGWVSIPGAAYLLLVLLNPWTKWLFDINLQEGYVHGPLIGATYLVFYLYCLAALLLIWQRGSWVEPATRRILLTFPLMAFFVILIQQIFPRIILSGSAATSALLLIYLYLQNKQISIDHLTGIPNRHEFLNMMELLIRKAQEPFTIVVLSLNHFKQINDAFGQENGDAFLQAVARYLKTVMQPRYLYRFSGDEFAILVKGKGHQEVSALVQKLRERMGEPWEIGEYQCILQAGLGVISYPECADSVENLINGIEYAVARAKDNNLNPVCYCDQKTLEELRRKNQVADILKEKLRTNSFELYYQPIYSLERRRFVLAESLLRIPQSPLGPLYPNEFIPIAEENGLIVEMTIQILHSVCKMAEKLREKSLELEGIHVNFSAVQFTQPDLAQQIFQILQEHSVPASKVRIEITESVLAENDDTVKEFAEEMRSQGVLMGLDDFGTGYSNIVSVMETPLDTVKLDRSLIWSSMCSQRSALMVKNLSRVFHEMSIKVVAEGVETEEQKQFAEECAIDLIQGYYYAKPLPEQEFLEFLTKEL